MKKTKQILCLFLSVCMIVSCMVGIEVTASAENVTINSLWIGNHAGVITSAGAIEDASTQGSVNVYATTTSVVVELNNFQYTGTGHNDNNINAGIYYTGGAPLTIVLKGDNSISTSLYTFTCDNYGIYNGSTDGGLNIKGYGTLSVATSEASNTGHKTAGIYSESTGITIAGNCTVDATGWTIYSGHSYGIRSGNSINIHNDATVTATGFTEGINAFNSNVILKSGTLKAISNNGHAVGTGTTISLAENSELIKAKAGVNEADAEELENGLADIGTQNFVHCEAYNPTPLKEFKNADATYTIPEDLLTKGYTEIQKITAYLYVNIDASWAQIQVGDGENYKKKPFVGNALVPGIQSYTFSQINAPATSNHAQIQLGGSEATGTWGKLLGYIVYYADTPTIVTPDEVDGCFLYPQFVTPLDLTAEVGQTLADVTFPTVGNGTWSWNTPTTQLTEIGRQKFKATYTPDDDDLLTVTYIEVPVTVLEYVRVPAAAATCTEDGNVEYYTKGEKYYTKSGDDYTETTLEAVTIPALGHDYKKTVIKEVTCTEDGEYEFKCSRCDSSYKSNPKAKGHKWNATYTWSEDYSTCTGDAVCKNDKSHTATETVNTTSEVIKAATCTRPGSMTYTAEFTDKAFKTQTKTVEIPALGHDRDENGVCKRCGDTPSRGPSGGSSTTPVTTTTTTTEDPVGTITGESKDGGINELSWTVSGNADKFDLYTKADGKFVYLQTTSEKDAKIICGMNGKVYVEDGDKYNVYTYGDGKFTKTGSINADKIGTIKVKNNVTNEFMVKCKSNGKALELKVAVKTYYKPAPTVKAKENGALLKWEKVEGATKYRLSKMVNGKLKKVADVNGTAINLTGLKSGKTYTYAVKALVNGKWTTVLKGDLVTVTAK